MSEQRWIDLEERMAHQEAALLQLSDVVAAQQRQIERLERTCRELASRLARQAEAAQKGAPADEVPPHY